eukprot:Hpha_TRINITY_DN15556_c1_g11::TRINITY_DN15556_c1_g11_i1::g.106919::m.106919
MSRQRQSVSNEGFSRRASMPRRSSSVVSAGIPSPIRGLASKTGSMGRGMLKAVSGNRDRSRSGSDRKGKNQPTKEDEMRQQYMERAERLEKEYDAELFAWAEQFRRDRQELLELRRESEQRADKIGFMTVQLQDLQAKHDKFESLTSEFEEDMQRQITRLTIDKHQLTEKVAGFQAIKEDLDARIAELTLQLQLSEMRVRDAEIVNRGIEHDASVMEQNLKGALNTARRENLALRMTHRGQEQELRSRLEDVQSDLNELLTRVESSVVPMETRAAAAADLDSGLELLSIRYQDLLQQCRLKVSRFSSDLIKVSSLHTNVPEYVKASLESQTDNQLRRLIDTLAFDESVRQYLEMLFPPPWESRQFFCPDTPSAALASGDLFVQGRRQIDERPSTAPNPLGVVGTKYPSLKALTRPQSVPGGKRLVPLSPGDGPVGLGETSPIGSSPLPALGNSPSNTA